MWVQTRMLLLVGVLFGLLYLLVIAVGSAIGAGGILFYGILAAVMVLVQYLISPYVVQWSMRVRWVTEQEQPQLHAMVSDLAREAKIPKPKVGISSLPVPNAFAFGRTQGDGRICVTEAILSLVDREELRAVLGHEISHIKHRDMAVISLLSLVPMVCYYVAQMLMWSSFAGGRRRGSSGYIVLIGVGALLLYFITNLLVMYASRLREYYADEGSVKLGSQPHYLASALYKLVYGAARIPKEDLKAAEGMKAFFVTDPSQAFNEFRELKQVDQNHSGSIDQGELYQLRQGNVRVGTSDKMLELMSTHPNTLKRMQRLALLAPY